MHMKMITCNSFVSLSRWLFSAESHIICMFAFPFFACWFVCVLFFVSINFAPSIINEWIWNVLFGPGHSDQFRFIELLSGHYIRFRIDSLFYKHAVALAGITHCGCCKLSLHMRVQLHVSYIIHNIKYMDPFPGFNISTFNLSSTCIVNLFFTFM